MPIRPKLVNVTLTFEAEGRKFTKDVDPAKVSAIFWTEHTVKNVLAYYYLPENPGQPKAKGMTEAKVMADWNTVQKDGMLPGVMVKYPECGSGPVDPTGGLDR